MAAAVLAVTFNSVSPWQAGAQQPVEQNRSGARLRIAIVFIANADDSVVARNMAQVIAGNLGRDRELSLIDAAQFIEKIEDTNRQPRFVDWRAISADVLVTGRIRHDTDGRLTAEFRLWDVAEGQLLMGRQYGAADDSQRLIAKDMSNEIYERLTGKKDAFD